MQIADRLKDIQPSATLALTAKAKLLKKEGKEVINFAAGEPDFDTPQIIKDAAIKAIQEGFTKYTPVSGIIELRQAISRKFKKDNNLDYAAEQIIVSCGAKHSLYNTLQALINLKDEVIIISPYWLSYPEMVKLAGGKPVILTSLQSQDFELNFEKLEELITKKTKAIIINSPSNPTGVVYSKAELKKIAALAVKHDLYVISDEIYEKLIYGSEKHFSIASFGNEIYNRTITVNGVSKTYSMTGWRIGYLGAPEKIAKAIATLQGHSTSNPASISQKGALAALNIPDSDLKPFIDEFSSRRDLLIEKLQEIPKLSVFKPRGAFYAFVDISKLKLTPADFAARLLDDCFVAIIPAESFGSKNHVRLSFATSKKDIVEGASRIKGWVEKNT